MERQQQRDDDAQVDWLVDWAKHFATEQELDAFVEGMRIAASNPHAPVKVPNRLDWLKRVKP